MGKKRKFIPTPRIVAAVKKDIGRNQYRIYHPDNPILSELLATPYLAKCSSVAIATSGQWMCVIPQRVDADKQAGAVHDVDPVMFMEFTAGVPSPSGVFTYHNPSGWNHQPIPGAAGSDVEALKKKLRNEIQESSQPVETVDERTKQVIHDMANEFVSAFGPEVDDDTDTTISTEEQE